MTQAQQQSASSYKTLWRWHFYAGLFVIPFLLVLAFTGAIYCFKPQLEPLLYPHLMQVRAASTASVELNTLRDKAEAAMPGAKAVSMVVLTDPERSVEFILRLSNGEMHSVYLNPYDGRVLGTLSVDDRFMQVVRMLHRKLMVGKVGELLMELAACWTLVMIGTGVAMWWPNGKQRSLEIVPKFALSGRAFLRSLHGVMGLWLALGAIAFVLTGLPWTGSWGKQFNSLVSSIQLGAPPGVWGDLPLTSKHAGHANAASSTPAMPNEHQNHGAPAMSLKQLPIEQVPWAVSNLEVPESNNHPSHAVLPLSIDDVVERVAQAGVSNEYSLALPSNPTGVFTVSYFPADPKLERTIYIDQYSGDVLHDIRYQDYGAISQAVSYGTSLHMGRYFGMPNQFISAGISLGLAAMAITGLMMWLRRKPTRQLGAPKRDINKPTMRSWLIGLAALGIVFPLMGITLIIVYAVDRQLFKRSSAI